VCVCVCVCVCNYECECELSACVCECISCGGTIEKVAFAGGTGEDWRADASIYNVNKARALSTNHSLAQSEPHCA
jgi:hypothetical protein